MLHEAELHGQGVILLFLGNEAVVGEHKPFTSRVSTSVLHRPCKATFQCVARAVIEGDERHTNHLQDIRGMGDCHGDGASKGQSPSEAAAAGHGRYLLLVIDGTWRQAKEMYKVARPAVFQQYGSS